ncbi:hypothetical protein ACEQ8H_004166 [Pleosporales sp. CAS-2024a]
MPSTMPITKAEREFITVRNRLQRHAQVQISTIAALGSFTKTFVSHIKSEGHLKICFATRAQDIKNSICAFIRDLERQRRLRSKFDAYAAFYNDRHRWMEKHGDMKDWTSFVKEITLPAEEFERMEGIVFRMARHALEALERLWHEVQHVEKKHHANMATAQPPNAETHVGRVSMESVKHR